MESWKANELSAIATSSELEIASRRTDGTLRDPVTIWMVRVGDDLYVRSVRGAEGGWYKGAQQRHAGRIEAGGVEKDVELIEADHGLDDEIDAAYKEKYGYPSSAVDHITSPEARVTTMRLVPAELTDA